MSTIFRITNVVLCFGFVAFLLSTAAFPVQAQLDKGFTGAKGVAAEAGLSTNNDFVPFIEKVINTLLGVVGFVALAALIWGGFVFITSAGDENRAATAKQIIKYAVIGLLVIGLSALIVNVTISAFQRGGSSGGSDEGDKSELSF